MKIVFKIKEDDARNPGVIADARATMPATQLVRARTDLKPTRDCVALITFILLGIPSAEVQVQLLVGSSS
jgi:K(+)-stimulated pyrophosphate-energized sodium pump